MIFRFKIWQNIKSVWPIYKTEFGTLLTLALVTALIKSGQSSENWILMAISFVLSILVTYAWIKYSLSLIDKERKFKVFTIKAIPSLNDFWNFILTVVLYIVIIFGGFLLLIIPGFYFMGRLLFASYLSADKKYGPLKSIKESWRITKGNGWRLFWKSFVIGLFVLLGVVALFIGWFVTFPISMLVLAKMYLAITEKKEEHKVEEKHEELKEEEKTEEKEEVVEEDKEIPVLEKEENKE